MAPGFRDPFHGKSAFFSFPSVFLNQLAGRVAKKDCPPQTPVKPVPL